MECARTISLIGLLSFVINIGMVDGNLEQFSDLFEQKHLIFHFSDILDKVRDPKIAGETRPPVEVMAQSLSIFLFFLNEFYTGCEVSSRRSLT
jgi:hypothetical protein